MQSVMIKPINGAPDPKQAVAPLRIAVIDDHRMFREGVVSLLGMSEVYDIVGQFESVEAALDGMATLEIDLLLLDLSLEAGESLPYIEALKADRPSMKVLMLSMHGDLCSFRRAFTAGADGYVLKRDAYDDLKDAIEVLKAGGRFFSPSISLEETKPTAVSSMALPERQAQIVRMVSEGKYNKQIAAELGIALSTVKNHLVALYRKFGVTNRVALLQALDKIAKE